MTADEYRRLRRDLDEAVSKMERAAGARDEALQRLRTEHKVATAVDANKLLRTLRAQLDRDAADLDRMRSEFTEKWGDKL